MMNSQKITESIKKILDETKFDIVLKKAIGGLYPSIKQCIFYLIIGIFLFFSTQEISFSKVIPEIINNSNEVILALLGIVITGYSIFQAMLSSESLCFLLGNNERVRNKNLFSAYQHNFLAQSVFYVLFLMINFLLLNIFLLYPRVLSSSYIFLKIFLIIYIIFNLHAILEMKSFIYNIYQSINLASIIKASKILENKNEDD